MTLRYIVRPLTITSPLPCYKLYEEALIAQAAKPDLTETNLGRVQKTNKRTARLDHMIR